MRLLLLSLLCCAHGARGQQAASGAYASSFESATASSVHALLLGGEGSERAPLLLPLEVSVALVGLNGDGAHAARVDSKALATLLGAALPVHVPSSLEAGRALSVGYALSYHVAHLPSALAPLEAALRSSLTAEGPGGAWEAPGQALEALLEAAYDTHFLQRTARAGHHAPLVLFLFAPDKRRLRPLGGNASTATATATARLLSAWGALGAAHEEAEAEDGALEYRHRYGGGELTCSWLGRGRYALVDLSAGPCTHGRTAGGRAWSPRPDQTDAGAGAGEYSAPEEATAGRVPRLVQMLAPFLDAAAPLRAAATAQAARSADPHADPGAARAVAELSRRFEGTLRSELAALAISAVRHLFAPDVRTKAVDVAARLLLPVITLADHVENATQRGAPALDVAALRAVASSLLQPGQEAVVVASTHQLASHPRLALALRRAMRASLSPGGAGAVLDSHALLSELRGSGDLLASGLLRLGGDEAVEAAFFNKHLPHVPDPARVQPPKPSRLSPPAAKASAGAGAAGAARRRRGGSSHGTRVVPLYLFALLHAPPGLLLDGEATHAGGRDCLVVLQTGDAMATTPFRTSGGAQARLRPADPARAAVAALAVALGGLAAPYERHCPLSGRRAEDWLWGTGAHPFGPFQEGNVRSEAHAHADADAHAHAASQQQRQPPLLSALLLDTARRNAVLTRLEAALGHVHSVREAVAAFARAFTPRPLDQALLAGAGRARNGSVSFLDALLRGGGGGGGGGELEGGRPLLPAALVGRMAGELAQLERQFVALARLLHEGEWQRAHAAASGALIAAYTLQDYVYAELDTAQQQLSCCRAVAGPAPAATGAAACGWLAEVVAGGLACACAVAACVRAARGPRPRSKGRFRD